MRTAAGPHLVQQRARLDLDAHAWVVRLEAVCGVLRRAPEETAAATDGA